MRTSPFDNFTETTSLQLLNVDLLSSEHDNNNIIINSTSFMQCSQCILDVNDDPKITFDEKGICNYCKSFDDQKTRYIKEGVEGEMLLDEKINEIKKAGDGKKYDCLIGLSGGVDSSYLAYVAKQKGLRPLCIHFDNSWNSELAVRNIHNIVHKLGFDLSTYVIDWEEFKDLQLAYLKASVIDIEVITDHAITAAIYQIALKHNLKYILDGQNVVTEAVLPTHWGWMIKDYINIKSIHKNFGQRKLKSYPFFSGKLRRAAHNAAIEVVCFLNWIPYTKKEAKKTLQEELDWVDYGGKHHENTWTRFFQVYILPKKFGVDKRKAHLSNLICSGQMTRDEALSEIATPPYDKALLEQDKKFVIKKLGLSEQEFDKIMSEPVRSHKDFDTEGSLFHYYPILKPLRPLWNFLKSIMHSNKVLLIALLNMTLLMGLSTEVFVIEFN
jgi:N-acetyl sugar amidotransferase